MPYTNKCTHTALNKQARCSEVSQFYVGEEDRKRTGKPVLDYETFFT